MSTKVAVIQKPPVLLDRDKTIASALTSIDEAAREGATLLIFPEAYIPGYPTWIWRLKPGGDMALSSEIHARLRQNAVDLGGNDLATLQEAAARRHVTIVLGLNEIDRHCSGTTLFNTVVVIGPDGAFLNRHRKLMPTNPERMIWGMGDATGLKVVDTPAGRLGCLICWESYMPLARYALYAQNIEIFVNPTWDYGETCLATLRHIAKEAARSTKFVFRSVALGARTAANPAVTLSLWNPTGTPGRKKASHRGRADRSETLGIIENKTGCGGRI